MITSRRFSPIFIAVLVAIGCGSSKPQDASAKTESAVTKKPIQLAQATSAAPTSGGGGTSIKGMIKFNGTAPERDKVKMSADPVCQQKNTGDVLEEDIVVNASGGLKNVFVYVKEGVSGDYSPTSDPVVLDQSGCWYRPHVFGIQVNQPLEIRNSDSTLHNVNAKPSANRAFNLAQPVQGMKTSKKFTKPEIGVPFKCNVHPWMSAYAGVVEHPFFAVSSEDGSFMISGLPAGSYVIEAWHEELGARTQNVTVAAGQEGSADFTFSK